MQSPWARRTDDGWTNESRGDAAIRQITAVAIFVLCDDEILGGKLFEVTSEHH